MKPFNLEMHIEELVLEGFALGDRHRIGDAVQQELTRLFTERPAPASLDKTIEVVRVDGGAFRVASGSKPETIGAQVAQTVYEGLNR
jgi:hypothetical protein